MAVGEPPKNPAPSWLSDKSWSEIARLSNIPTGTFKGLVEDFTANPLPWKAFYDSLAPQDEVLSGPWEARLNSLQVRMYGVTRVTRGSPGYYEGISGVLRGDIRGITRGSPGCYEGISGVLRGDIRGVTRGYPGYYEGISGVLRGDIRGITRGCPGYYEGISGVLRGDIRGITRGYPGLRGYGISGVTKVKISGVTRIWISGVTRVCFPGYV